jgi:hypothetical protein
MQVPGTISTNVLVNGLHRTQGSTPAGTAKMKRVAMAKHTYALINPSVSRNSVTPNEILLSVMAIRETVRPVAPIYVMRSKLLKFTAGAKNKIDVRNHSYYTCAFLLSLFLS